MNEKKLSIVTICYNDLNALKLTVKSVKSQTLQDFEWIVIDGCSTDGSREYIKSDVASIAAYWCSEPDGGIYNAMNKGVLHAAGEYCLFLNAGDEFCSPKSLERAFARIWDADIISCDEFVISNKKFWDYIQAPRTVTFHRILLGYLPHQTTFIRTQLLREYPYREDYKIVADWAFWWETLVASSHSYQHFGFPLAAFDCTGVSSTNAERNKAERERFLANYIPDRFVLNRIIKECKLQSTIEGDFLNNSERSALRFLAITVRRINVHLIEPLHKVYANIRWRSK